MLPLTIRRQRSPLEDFVKSSLLRQYCQLTLLLLLLIASSLQTMTRAAELPPPPQPSSAQPHNAVPVKDVKHLAPATQPRPTPTPEDKPPPSKTPAVPLRPQRSAIIAATTQGVINLNVEAPATIRAGDYINYTYVYTNTANVSAGDVQIQLLWADFALSPMIDANAWQWCLPGTETTNCGLQATSVVGPAVHIMAPPCSTASCNMKVGLDPLAAHASGRFTVRLQSNSAIYPQSGQPIRRPAGSGQLFTSIPGGNGSTTPTSEDTANTMAVGPVFALSKTTDQSQAILPNDEHEFVLHVGNTTNASDLVNGQPRADAIPATNVIVSDTIPTGGQYDPASPAPSRGTVTFDASTITWTIPTLATGESLDLHLLFRKVDGPDCNSLSNVLLKLTSAEMPVINGAPAIINGSGTSVGVVAPLRIQGVEASPNPITFGTPATISITIQSYWPHAMSGVRLNYNLQTNLSYIAGSAQPVPTSAPNGTTPGGMISWTFDMPAGSISAPVQKTFAIRVQAGYTSATGAGDLQIIAPTGVPSACIVGLNVQVGLRLRLSYSKTTDTDPATRLGSDYIVHRGQEFDYVIGVQNEGVTDATGIDVADHFPNQTGANFQYVVGSSTLDGQSRPPDSYTNGLGGNMHWNNLTVPAGKEIYLRYRMVVDGRDYYEYCNSAQVTKQDGEQMYVGSTSVCVKINPNIAIRKTANRNTARPGDQVQFTLTMTNYESSPYTVGLVDNLGAFNYVGQVSGYGPTTASGGFNGVEWPLISLAPQATVSAVITAAVPAGCVNQTYTNEALFKNQTDYVVTVPDTVVSVNVSCDLNQLMYSKSADHSPISLQDQVVYTLQVTNGNSINPMTNITVNDILAAGLTYGGIDNTSPITTEPVQTHLADGSTHLTWTIPSIVAQSSGYIKYIARSGNVVGTPQNLMQATAAGMTSVCQGHCVTYNNELAQYSDVSITVQPLLTLDPEFVETTCAHPGDTRTYQLTLVNTNSVAYTITNVQTTLPFGLSFVKQLSGPVAPTATTDGLGLTTVSWSSLQIAAKGGGVATQVVMTIQVQVGQVLGDLVTTEQTTPAGSIPRKDGVQNAAIHMCIAGPTIAKEASPHTVHHGDSVLYQIALSNPSNTQLSNVTVTDQLPPNMAFVAQVAGPMPTQNGNILTWTVSVPGGTTAQPGVLNLQFRAQLANNAPDQPYTNTATATGGTTHFDTTYGTVTINGTIQIKIFMPLIRR